MNFVITGSFSEFVIHDKFGHFKTSSIKLGNFTADFSTTLESSILLIVAFGAISEIMLTSFGVKYLPSIFIKSFLPYFPLSTFAAITALALESILKIFWTRNPLPAGMWSIAVPFTILLTESFSSLIIINLAPSSITLF